MAALVFVPINSTLALVIGVLVGVVVIATLIWISPVIEIDDVELRVGRAHIAHRYLGEAEAFVGEDARRMRGVGLDPKWWHLFRPSIDPVVVVRVADDDDPITAWAFSSRMPERVVAVLERQRARDVPVARTLKN